MTFQNRLLRAGLAAFLLGACGQGEPPARDADAARDIALQPAESIAAINDQPPAPQPQQPAARSLARQAGPNRDRPATASQPAAFQPTLPAGTVIELTAQDTITSRRNKAGDPVTAVSSADVRDAQGRVVIPAGATFLGTIVEIKPAERPGGQGTLRLAFERVEFGGKVYGVRAEADTLQTEQQGRGVTAGDAAKVGVGAAAGAVAGRIIGGDRRGTVIGGVVGAAAGAGVAAATKDEDIVLPAGGRIRLVLQEETVLAPVG